MKINSKNSGFTLIELIIYIAIVSIILVSISYLMIDILKGSVSSIAKTEVNHNIRLLVWQLNKDIHGAAAVKDISAESLTLQLSDGHELKYFFDLEAKKLISQLDGGQLIQVHSDDINVEGDFSSLSFMDKTKGVDVNLIISYKNPSGRQEYDASANVNLGVELYGRR
ncbi:MAG: prepilin-type N-terminal cleavage/methylation domain-containing protein [Candidatus Buchananbacteria bacterium]|nr:prepilin-type N-terminal cleavage/methylation domain-containing protein [Candidatus Buchananbacteria bacterium]